MPLYRRPSSGTGSTKTKIVEVDFGSTPKNEQVFTVADVDATPLKYIVGEIAYLAPTGKMLDEIEIELIDVKCAALSGQVQLFIRGMEGALHGAFKVAYTIG